MFNSFDFKQKLSLSAMSIIPPIPALTQTILKKGYNS